MIGQKFGLVTVVRRDQVAARGAPWFGVCECGGGRWFHASNLRRHPPKTHKFCPEAVDTVRK